MEQNFINTNQNQEEAQQNPSYVPQTNSSNSDTTYNSTQDIICPEEPYYSSQSTDKVQQYPAQPYPAQQYPAQSYSTQNMAVPPNKPYYPPQGNTPIQHGVPANSYQLQPMGLNGQPIPQNQYHKPYTLVEHKGIFQQDNNTYYLTIGNCYKYESCIPFVIGLLFILASIYYMAGHFLPIIIGSFFIFFSFLYLFFTYHSIFFILGPNTLTVIKKALCLKRSKIYNPGDLQRIDFTLTKGNGSNYNHVLKVVEKNGKEGLIFNTGYTSLLFTADEIEYFLYTINTHIQTKMRV